MCGPFLRGGGYRVEAVAGYGFMIVAWTTVDTRRR
jgi:hypothetical protein